MSDLKKTDISDMDFGGVVPSAAPLKHAASGDVFLGVFFPGGRLMLYTQLVRKRDSKCIRFKSPRRV